MVATTSTESTSKTKTPARKGNGRYHGRGGRKTKAKSAAAQRQSSALSSYGRSATRFAARGRDALSGAYSWADSTARDLPANMPDMASLRNMANERPLVLGAIGLGIGLLLGVMWPSHSVMPWRSSAAPRGRRRGTRR